MVALIETPCCKGNVGIVIKEDLSFRTEEFCSMECEGEEKEWSSSLGFIKAIINWFHWGESPSKRADSKELESL